jgi:hypothetical protein
VLQQKYETFKLTFKGEIVLRYVIVDWYGWTVSGMIISFNNNLQLVINLVFASKTKKSILHMDHGWSYASYKFVE